MLLVAAYLVFAIALSQDVGVSEDTLMEERARTESLCGLSLRQLCRDKNESVQKIFATLNMTNESLSLIRMVMPTKFKEFMIQVIDKHNRRVGNFVDSNGSLIDPCIEYADYKSDGPINETDVAIHVQYLINSSFNLPAKLVVTVPSEKELCFYRNDLLEIKLLDGSEDLNLEGIIDVPETAPIDPRNDNHTSQESEDSDYSSEEIGGPTVDSNEHPDNETREPVLGYDKNGTWVFFPDEPEYDIFDV